ncbi:hypothetical protein DSS11_18650 [Salmonella enterica subsp. enterica serovar Braenderup]|nr:hypothetical protein [Salmonella enterica subsp. enterica serovar Braenderup]ELS3421660.1 hypothetical protein [Salmonella enterica]HBM0095568.1 hypothetical protein [Salmonella enterica subsp. enterica serovar Blitta]EBX6156427.1 hypothetical protein [Salmonella enterica subsp. enterica serovar Braenderup]ECQ7191388.1 hypothetical protein [Salmonella enterica subsp. enterica serovar Braenderup]
MPLPNREYYPIEKAAKKLDCDVDDLIHFIAMRKMNFWIKIYLNEVLFLSECETSESEENKDTEDGNLINEPYEEKFTYLSKNKLTEIGLYSILESLYHTESFSFDDEGNPVEFLNEWFNHTVSSLFHSLRVEPSKEIDNKKGYPKTITLTVSGLMNVTNITPDMDNLSLYKNEGMEVGLIYISSPKRNEKTDNIFIRVSNKKINIDDIYISQDEMDLIVNGGRSYFYQPPTREAPPKNSAKTNSAKTNNAQARVIKALIEAIGGKHAANHPRSAIENHNSELNKGLDRAGVKLPATGVAVERWLKGID